MEIEHSFRVQEDEKLSDVGINREIVRKEIDLRTLNLRGQTMFFREFLRNVKKSSANP